MSLPSDYLFTNNNSIYRNQRDNNTESTVVYTADGHFETTEPIDDTTQTTEGNEICAKIVHRANGSKKYMIRLDSNGKLYNPVSIYGIEKNNTFLDRVCRSNQRFKEVSEKVINLYIGFLTNKNIALLTNAEREAE